MAASTLQLALTNGLLRVLSLRRVQGLGPETGGLRGLSHLAGKVWCAKSQASNGIQVFSWRKVFADPTQWLDNRRSKPTARHLDFTLKKAKVGLWLNGGHKPPWMYSHLTTWDSGMKVPPKVLSNGQGSLSKVSVHLGRFEVEMGRKLCEDGRITEAVEWLNHAVQRGWHVPNNLFYLVLKRCIALKDLVLGRRIHGLTVKSGYERDAFLATHLIGLYASHRRLEEAMRVFSKVAVPSSYNWATIIFAYARHGKGAEAIQLYQQMRGSTTIIPTNCVYVAVLKACAAAGDLFAGKGVHADILSSPRTPDIFVHTGLVDMYAKCRSLDDARCVFDGLSGRNVVTWTAMIAGYAEQGMSREALILYDSMQEEGPTPNSVTFICLLHACAGEGAGALHEGKQLHAHIENRGLQNDVALGGGLVSMYAKCGSLQDAISVFDRLPDKNMVTWTAMIAGYVQHGMGHEALCLYSSMQHERITPDSVTFVCILQACAIVADLPLGKHLHAQIEEQGLQYDVVVGAALVNMYAKCGSMFHSRQVFDSLPERTIETWGALTAGYTRQGDSDVVFDLVEKMRVDGLQPDGITFLSVLTSCSHVGLLDKGRKYFECMTSEYGISPSVEHYLCMMDLLGRAGHLKEALQIARTMPFPPNSNVSHTLLGACQKWNSVEIGQQAFEFAMSVDPRDAASYVLMSNIYAASEMWEEAKELETRRIKYQAWKELGQSWWTDMDGVMHTFVVGNKNHPGGEGIYARLDQLVPKTKTERHVRHLGFSTNTFGVPTSNHAQKIPMAGSRCFRVNNDYVSRVMAPSLSQRGFGLTGTACFPTVPTLQDILGRVTWSVGLKALSQLASNRWCVNALDSFGGEGILAEELQEYFWQQFFANPTQWWDNRQRKETPWHADFMHKNSNVGLWLNNVNKPAWVNLQLATLDSRMIGAPKSVSTSAEGQGALGQIGACNHHLEVQMCSQLCEDGRIIDTVDALNLLVLQGRQVDNNIFYRVLKWCIVHKQLVLGRRIHALSITGGYLGDAFLATHLIGMYASHGRMKEAMQVFTNVAAPDAYNWAAIIFAYGRHGDASEAIRLYQQMRDSTTVMPTDIVYLAVLKACAIEGNLIAGKEVHAHILASPGKPDIFVQTSLVYMYAKCRRLEDARYLFDRLPGKTVVTWNALLSGYAQQGMGREAISLYKRMQHEGLTAPDSVTYVCVLQACASVGAGALDQGKQLHAQIEGRGLQDDVVLGGSLVNMYAKCGTLEHAGSMFDRLPARNVVTWTVMIAGYAEQGMGEKALSLYGSMQEEGITPNSVTFVCLLQACASLGVRALDHGQQLHARIRERGLQDDVLVGGSLVHMYAKSGRVEDARSIFDRLPNRNVVTWNAMIGGYSQQDMGGEALRLYSTMLQGGHIPDSVTFVCLLQACASLGVGAMDRLKQLHTQIEELGLQDDVVLGTSLVNMYAKCGSLEDARSVFNSLPTRNVVTWTAMIAGYAEQGMGQEALSLYSAMQEEGLTLPDSVAFVCLLQACAIVGLGALDQGKQLHSQIEEGGLQDDVVLGGSLVAMYAKCSTLEDARCMFNRLPARNVITWTAMIAGYSQQQMGEEALTLYTSMQQEGVAPPDSVTFVCLLQACATVAALPVGKQLHAQIEEKGLLADVYVGSALLHMYAKCGSMFDAQEVFDSLTERTIEAWGALIGGYARQGDSEAVFDLLDRMRLEGMQPNGIVFLSVLAVCSHVGLVSKGRKYFEEMKTEYGIIPTVEHYICLIDLLGRAGHLDESLHIALTMPFPPEVAVWLTLLGACGKWKNVEIGQQAFEFAVSLDRTDATFYVLMSNIYASCEMWEEAKEMQVRRLKSGARKEPGQSWTDMGGVVHTFVAGKKTS